MHSSVMSWMSNQVTSLGVAQHRTLEVGSLDVNGSVRGCFNGSYVGTDMRDGRGVDVVLNAHDLSAGPSGIHLDLGSEPFDVIVCTEMLEHDDQPWTSLCEMREVAQDNAVLLLTARGYDSRGCFPLHGYPEDLWRFSTSGMTALLNYAGWTPQLVIADPEEPGVFALAFAT
jgi:hypothetical protein